MTELELDKDGNVTLKVKFKTLKTVFVLGIVLIVVVTIFGIFWSAASIIPYPFVLLIQLGLLLGAIPAIVYLFLILREFSLG